MAFADNSFITWKKYAVIILGIILFIMSGCDNDKSSDKPSSKRPKDPNSVTLETDSFRYVIGLDGKNKQFIDKKTATDYCSHTAESYCAQVKLGGKDYTVSSVSQDGSKIILKFSEPGISVVLTTTEHENYVEIEVESIEGGDAESLVFVNIPLTLGGRPEDPFGICAFSLNKFTHVMQLPALQKHPRASCYKRFGMIGAKVALIGVPVDTMLTVLKELVTNAGDLPKTTVSGPWADEIPFNHGSYLFNFGDLTLNTVDDWIAMAKSLGVTQIDNHGGGENFFRFGDFELNRKKWPNGWDDYKEIVARLHKAGIGSIFHTYCFFIDKKSKYVTPVPHPQLDAFRSFELKVPLSKDATEITVVESTENMSTITGFFVHNSITLHIDDELVTFGGFTKKAPYKFTGCTRGAFGTKAASHSKGAKARHLKECFGLFVPDAESELYEEIAKNHADVINYCDFDGIYLDAIDGTSILRGGEDAWYYGSKFLFDIWKHLEKPVGMEMSAMWHHFWQFRSRWQAWDYPTRGQKQFIDIHANAVNSGLLLPLHLGWWNFQTFTPPQVEPTFPDVIEYLGCKMIGFNAGISLTGAINKDNLNKIPAHRRSVGILKRYEQLRRSNIFDESVKKRLREPGKDFTLFMDSEKKWKFRPIHYDKHKIEGVNHPTSAWEAENTFHRQPVKLRIEALMSAGSYNDTVNVVLADFSDSKNFAENIHAEGVTSSLQQSSEQMKSGELSV